MAKILILSNYDAGLYKFRKELISELLKENDIYISLPRGEYIPMLEEMGCSIIETPINRRGTNPFADLKLMANYRSILKKIKPDLVLTYTIKPNVYGGIACRLEKIPYISNVTGLGTSLENKGILQNITLFLYKLSLKESSCVFVQNAENLNFLNDHGIIKSKHKLIPGSGVNINEFSLLDYPPEKEINFLFIARVMKEKGIDQYLDTAKYIKNKYPNTNFHILGFCEQDYEIQLKKMHSEGIVQYYGMQKNVHKFHATSHCTIHPTYYPEGMSNVLLESAPSGRPIITTNRSGCKEIIDDNINGYIVKEKNSNDLIEKVEAFLKLSHKEKEKMGLKGREKIEGVFNRKIVIDAYLSEINNIVRDL